MTPLESSANGQKFATLRFATAFGRPHVARVHTDARFYGHEQFTLVTSVAVCPDGLDSLDVDR
jgi:hypothetical protein